MNNHNNHLVYMAVFHKKDYLELLKILMVTIHFFSKTDTLDFLVLTTESFEDDIVNISNLTGIPISMKFFTFTTMYESLCARLFIFDYENIHMYEKILYIDTDIVVINDITKIFEIPIEDKLYALGEGGIQYESWGSQLFDFNLVNADTLGMNSGILFFKNTNTIRTIFKNIMNHMKFFEDNHIPMPCCPDQAFINYYSIKDGNHDTDLMRTYAVIYSKDAPLHPVSPSEIIFCHFTWPIGNAMNKRIRMIDHMNHIFNNYTAIYPGVLKNNNPVLKKTFSWVDTDAVIHFDEHRLLTTWDYGNYKWLDTYLLEANWSGCNHILCMNKDYTSFIAIRKDDFNIATGVLLNR